MEWKPATKQGDQAYQIPERWLHLHYYEALNVLFRIENALRMLTYVVLKNAYFSKWVEAQAVSDDAEPISIDAIAKKRFKQNQNYGYLGFSITCPIMHLTSGELVRIIFSEKNWPLFKEFFPGSKENMRSKLDEIGNIRNALAHFRPISVDDVSVVKQNAKHALMAFEKCLSSIFSFPNAVATNTADAWYHQLKSIKSDLMSLEMIQSEDELWVELKLKYASPILKLTESSPGFRRYQVAKLQTPNVLSMNGKIKNYVTYVTESRRWIRMPRDGNPDFSKVINLIFKKEVLEKYHTEICADLRELMGRLADETSMIQNDLLARGKLISVASAIASLEKKGDKTQWVVRSENLYDDAAEVEHPEYWGKDDWSFTQDIIAATERYPWMPVDVSTFELSF